MPTPTPTESLIRQLKYGAQSNQVLVPLIEKYMQVPLELEIDDMEWMDDIWRRRSLPRKSGMYSPSQIGSCIRQTYLSKTEKIPKQYVKRIESAGYFLDGNFRHLKWQFVLYRMDKDGLLKLLGTEVPVISKKGDYGGTIDSIIQIEDTIYIVDWKGMNAHSFMNAAGSGPPGNYVIQSTAYALLANEVLELPGKITKFIIVAEKKDGPSGLVKMPLGLREWTYDVEEEAAVVRRRMKTLRSYENKEETPPPECVSTKRLMFITCPFSNFCLSEVEQIERSRKKDKSYKFQTPKR